MLASCSSRVLLCASLTSFGCSSHATTEKDAPLAHSQLEAGTTHVSTVADGAQPAKQEDGSPGPGCPVEPSASPDFSFKFDSNAAYDGPISVTLAGDAASTLDLVTSDGQRATLQGVIPDVAGVTTLWAGLHTQHSHPNPYADVVTRDGALRASAGGPLVAGVIWAGIYAAEFFGVPLTYSQICTGTGPFGPCSHTDVYAVTFQADEDVTISSGAHGDVSIGGIGYDVWVDASNAVVPPACMVADYAGSPGLSIEARVSHYEDVLKPR